MEKMRRAHAGRVGMHARRGVIFHFPTSWNRSHNFFTPRCMHKHRVRGTAVVRGAAGGADQLVGSVGRTYARGGERLATHPLSRFVTLRSPSALRPVLVVACNLRGRGALRVFRCRYAHSIDYAP